MKSRKRVAVIVTGLLLLATVGVGILTSFLSPVVALVAAIGYGIVAVAIFLTILAFTGEKGKKEKRITRYRSRGEGEGGEQRFPWCPRGVWDRG